LSATPDQLGALTDDLSRTETDDASGLRDEITKKFGVTPRAFGAPAWFGIDQFHPVIGERFELALQVTDLETDMMDAGAMLCQKTTNW